MRDSHDNSDSSKENSQKRRYASFIDEVPNNFHTEGVVRVGDFGGYVFGEVAKALFDLFCHDWGGLRGE